MNDKRRIEEATKRYRAAAHAVQSGIASRMEIDLAIVSPKHMRVSIDLRAADQAGLATLLMEKGIFTAAEYHEAMAKAAEDEQKRVEEQLSKHFGREIKLA